MNWRSIIIPHYFRYQQEPVPKRLKIFLSGNLQNDKVRCSTCKILQSEFHVLWCRQCDEFICANCLTIAQHCNLPAFHDGHPKLTIHQLKIQLQQEQASLQHSVQEIVDSILISSADAERFVEKVSVGVKNLDEFVAPTLLFFITPAIHWATEFQDNVAMPVQSAVSFASFDLNRLEDAADACTNMCNEANRVIAALHQVELDIFDDGQPPGKIMLNGGNRIFSIGKIKSMYSVRQRIKKCAVPHGIQRDSARNFFC